MQHKAVEWDGGPLLVLAGPGSGKTHVLTRRIASLLENSPQERFRVLALTFTNRAAHEMKTRVGELVPGLEERTEIKTFHGFCAQVLRQHGSHCGIKSNFEIYSRTADRQALLKDALEQEIDHFPSNNVRLLSHIDSLKAHLVSPERATSYLQSHTRLTPEEIERTELAYRRYEEELRRSNALDFNSLILHTFSLLQYPALVRLYQTIYRYWLIDEFQDTSASQYELLKRMTGEDFRRLFAVADDDQTIYEWNGANVHRIRDLVKDFQCEVIQLTDNFRCPPRIVEAANRLLVYNVRRSESKQPAKAVKPKAEGAEPEVQDRVFGSDEEEAFSIAEEISSLSPAECQGTAVLARTRTLLEVVQAKLDERGVPCELLARKDDFASPQMRWLVACLKQINRPLDRRNLATMHEAFRSFASNAVHLEKIHLEELFSWSAADQVTLLTTWIRTIREVVTPMPPAVETVAHLASGDISWLEAVNKIIQKFDDEVGNGDLNDDVNAWHRIGREIYQDRGRTIALDEFLQELEMRSKERTPRRGSVHLATIHGAKGLEFDRVYLMGLAEEVLPSWHSVKNGNGSAALEEERRGCFVAITRACQHLVLSRAESYKGWPKEPSRFLDEMGLL